MSKLFSAEKKETLLSEKETKDSLSLPYIIGTSVKGPSHEELGLPCQDAFAFRILEEGMVFIAVSDGLGSIPKSEIGAKCSVESAVEYITKNMINIDENLKDLMENIVSFSRKSLENKAKEIGCCLEDLACTLIVVLASKDGVAVYHIGDGGVVGMVDNKLEIISEPEELEYANEVYPLTSQDWKEHLRYSELMKEKDIKIVSVFTDGCQRAALQKIKGVYKPFYGFLSPIFDYAKKVSNIEEAGKDIQDLLNSEMLSDFSGDDKTLVIAILNI